MAHWLPYLTFALVATLAGCEVVGGIQEIDLAHGGGDASADATVDAAADATTDSGGGGDAPSATDSEGGGNVDATVDAGREPPSCADSGATCGPAGSDCCARAPVTGGTFLRSYDGVDGGGYDDASFPATVGSFVLDVYEVNVARFRVFVQGYPGDLPAPGSGTNANDPGDPGWSASYPSMMPPDQPSLVASMTTQLGDAGWGPGCPNPANASYSSTPGAKDQLPINCISWYEAYAFCIWDGGRLPTEAEWNYAAAGGVQQRAYPWSTPSTDLTLDLAHAVYNVSVPQNVGMHPMGAARWGQMDMAGNVWEWTLDWFGPYPTPCNDCENLTPSQTNVFRGGAFTSAASGDELRTGHRFSQGPAYRDIDIGVRCARNP